MPCRLTSRDVRICVGKQKNKIDLFWIGVEGQSENVPGGDLAVDAAVILDPNFTFDKTSVGRGRHTTTGCRDGEEKCDDRGRDAREGSQEMHERKEGSGKDRHEGMGASEKECVKQNRMEHEGGGPMGSSRSGSGAHGVEQNICGEGTWSNETPDQKGHHSGARHKPEGGEGKSDGTGEEVGNKECEGQTNNCSTDEDPEGQYKRKESHGKRGRGEGTHSGSGGSTNTGGRGGSNANRMPRDRVERMGDGSSAMGSAAEVDNKERSEGDRKKSEGGNAEGDKGRGSVPGTGIGMGRGNTRSEGKLTVEQGIGGGHGTAEPGTRTGHSEARHKSQVCDARAEEARGTFQIFQDQRRSEEGEARIGMDLLQLQVGLNSMWPECEEGSHAEKKRVLWRDEEDTTDRKADSGRPAERDQGSKKAGSKVPVCMGKRGVWGAEALPEDAKGPRGGDTSVRVRVWEEEPETLQGMDEPRSEEDIPPDPPYGQSINVRDVQERAPTRGGHVPQERIRAEASKGGGPDDTGSKKQGAVEDGSAHIGGAEASMGERERRSGESKEPEWMGHMRRRYNVLYEAPEGIIQEVESAEDVAESWAEAGMPAVAVAIETLSDDKNNYLPDDWVHPTVHRDSLKNPGKRKQSKANSPGEKGAPGGATAVGNPLFEQQARAPRRKREPAGEIGPRKKPRAHTQAHKNSKARRKAHTKRHGLTAARPAAPTGGARAPQEERRRQQKHPRQEEEQLEEEPAAARRRVERNQPKGYG